jgi:alginate lyase
MKRMLLLALLALSLLIPVPTQAAASSLWLSPAELAVLPMSGAAWGRVKAAADGALGSPNIADQDSKHDVKTLAVALVYARTGNASYRAKAAQAILSAIGTEAGGRTLALGRNLVSYVIAADLIQLRAYRPADDARFRAWLARVRTETLDGQTLISTHERRPNNWGTHAGASRVAADIYLGDAADLARAAAVFRGWLGERAVYAGFRYGDLSWQCSSSAPVGINPAGCLKSGHPVGGVLPDDQRRGGSFAWPPPCENYTWEARQGALVEAQLLARAGYPAWEWSNRALLRSVQWSYGVGCAATGDDTWAPALANRAYGTGYAVGSGVGKNMAWTDWTHTR